MSLKSIIPFLAVSLSFAAPSVRAEINVFPNPVRAYAGNSQATFDGLPAGAGIKIYDPQGRLVRELSLAGGSQIVWDLKNDSGQGLASGVYVYLIKSAGQKQVGKLAIIR